MKIDGFIQRFNKIINETNKRISNIDMLEKQACKEDPSKVRIDKIEDDLNFIALNILRSKEVETGKKVFGKEVFGYKGYKVFDDEGKLKKRDYNCKSKYEICFRKSSGHTELIEFLGKDFEEMIHKLWDLIEEYQETMKADKIFGEKEEKDSGYSRYSYRTKTRLNIELYNEKFKESVFWKESNYDKSKNNLIKTPVNGVSITLKEGYSSDLDLEISVDMKDKGYQNTEWQYYTIITNDRIYKSIVKGVKEIGKVIKKYKEKRSRFEKKVSQLYKKYNFYKYLTLRGL
jgi:hypothetical protein